MGVCKTILQSHVQLHQPSQGKPKPNKTWKNHWGEQPWIGLDDISAGGWVNAPSEKGQKGVCNPDWTCKIWPSGVSEVVFYTVNGLALDLTPRSKLFFVDDRTREFHQQTSHPTTCGSWLWHFAPFVLFFPAHFRSFLQTCIDTGWSYTRPARDISGCRVSRNQPRHWLGDGQM